MRKLSFLILFCILLPIISIGSAAAETQNFENSGIEFKDNYVYLTDNTTQDKLREILGSNITVGVIGTGGTLMYDNVEYTIVIKGDVNGDGSVDAVDYLLAKRAYLGYYTLSEAQVKACAFDDTPFPTEIDLLKIKRHILGNYNLFAKREVVLRFAVMSDIHLNGSTEQTEYKRFEQAIDFMYSYSAGQAYKNFDLLMVAGDMSNTGSESELQAFANAVSSKLQNSTRKLIIMGNHEYYNNSAPADVQQRWESIIGTTKNTHLKVNGYHFIGISLGGISSSNEDDYDYIVSWLDEELAKAAAEDPGKPIFVAQHHHIKDTVYGSDLWGTSKLTEVLSKYPQVVDFSGHSHYPINDPRSIHQDKFTCLGTGTLSYFELESGMVYGTIPPNANKAAQFYVVEVYNDNSIDFKPYDLITSQFFPTKYSIENPAYTSNFVYTDKRYEKADTPKFEEGTTLNISNITDTGCTLTFKHATDGENVHSYRYDFYLKSTGAKVYSFKTWSEFYFLDRPENMTYTTGGLEPGTEYRVTVTAIDSFGKESEPIEAFFKTTGTSDPGAPVTADVLDVVFGADGAKDNGSLKKTVENFTTTIEQDSSLGGAYVAKFDGVDDYLRIKFTADDYARYNQKITLAAKFKFDEFTYSDVIGCMQAGGYGFELNSDTRQIEFWIHINGSYVILKSDITAGAYHTVVGTYDGSTVKLYVDGENRDSKAASGPITYPAIAAAHGFCVGADINGSGEGEYFFKGNVAYAKVYSVALTAQQVASLQ